MLPVASEVNLKTQPARVPLKKAASGHADGITGSGEHRKQTLPAQYFG